MKEISGVHTADIHIGKFPYGIHNAKTGLDTSLESTLKCLDEFTYFAIKNKVNFAAFCGDFSKEKTLTELERTELGKRFKRLIDAGIIVVCSLGNHDFTKVKGKVYNIKSFKIWNLKNLYIVDEPTVIKGNGFIILSMPFINDVDEWIIEYKKIRKKVWGNKLPIFVMLHGNVVGAKIGSELLQSDEPTSIPTEIFDKNIVVVMAGHNHEYQVIGENPPVIYSGSIDRVKIDERDHKKGFLYYKYNGKLKREFVEVDARKFIQIEMKNNDIPDIDFKNSIVRVILNMQKSNFIDIDQIEQSIKEKGAIFVSVKKKILNTKNEKKFNLRKLTTFQHRIADWAEENVDLKFKESVVKTAKGIIDECQEEK